MTTRIMAADCARLIEELNLDSPIVVGISMGAGIAQELALARPELVRKLVLVAPWARCDAYTRSVLNVLGGVRALGAARPFNELLRNTVWTAEWINAHCDAMETDLNSPPGMSAAAFGQQVQACQDHDTVARLHEIQMPTLVTLGDEDVFIRPELSLEVAAQIRGAEVRSFRGAGHVHHWEQLDSFNETIGAWAR